MTRVATISQQQLLVDTLLRNQQRVFDHQEQVASGNRSSTYQGIARDVATLQSAKTVKERTETFLEANRDLNRRLETYNAALLGLQGVAQDLRQNIIEAVNTGSGIALRDKINDLFDTAVSLLNTRDAGRFIFSGTRTDQQTVTATDTAQLAALGLGNHADAFANNTIKSQSQIDENRTLEYGVLGDQVGTELFDIFQRLVMFDDGTSAQGFPPAGPFNDPLDDNQRDFLIGMLSEATEAFDVVNRAVALNGVNQKTLEQTQARHEADLTFIKIFIGDIEDVDAAEAISQLNLDQVALEASFRTFSQLTRLNLIDFL